VDIVSNLGVAGVSVGGEGGAGRVATRTSPARASFGSTLDGALDGAAVSVPRASHSAAELGGRREDGERESADRGAPERRASVTGRHESNSDVAAPARDVSAGRQRRVAGDSQTGTPRPTRRLESASTSREVEDAAAADDVSAGDTSLTTGPAKCDPPSAHVEKTQKREKNPGGPSALSCSADQAPVESVPAATVPVGCMPSGNQSAPVGQGDTPKQPAPAVAATAEGAGLAGPVPDLGVAANAQAVGVSGDGAPPMPDQVSANGPAPATAVFVQAAVGGFAQAAAPGDAFQPSARITANSDAKTTPSADAKPTPDAVPATGPAPAQSAATTVLVGGAVGGFAQAAVPGDTFQPSAEISASADAKTTPNADDKTQPNAVPATGPASAQPAATAVFARAAEPGFAADRTSPQADKTGSGPAGFVPLSANATDMARAIAADALNAFVASTLAGESSGELPDAALTIAPSAGTLRTAADFARASTGLIASTLGGIFAGGPALGASSTTVGGPTPATNGTPDSLASNIRESLARFIDSGLRSAALNPGAVGADARLTSVPLTFAPGAGAASTAEQSVAQPPSSSRMADAALASFQFAQQAPIESLSWARAELAKATRWAQDAVVLQAPLAAAALGTRSADSGFGGSTDQQNAGKERSTLQPPSPGFASGFGAPVSPDLFSTAPAGAQAGARAGAAAMHEPATESGPLTQSIVRVMKLQISQGGGEVQLRLNPEHLGELTVSVRVESGSVSATLRSESPVVRAWIEQHQQELRNGLRDSGLTLDKLAIDADARPRDQQAKDSYQAEQQPYPRRQVPLGQFEALI